MSGRLRRRVWGALAVAAAVALIWGCAVWYVGFREWFVLHGEIHRMLSGMEKERPASVDPWTWDCAMSAVKTAFANVCFSKGHVSTAEMRRLRDDLKEIDAPADLETFDRIWERLGETGPHGRRYVKRHDYLLRECRPEEGGDARASSASAPAGESPVPPVPGEGRRKLIGSGR